MSIRSLSSLATVILALGIASPLAAQGRTAVSGAELDAAVATRPSPRGTAIRDILQSEQAQQAAAKMGVSAGELTRRVTALDDAALEQLARQGETADPGLAGGADSIVISTTAVIIVLLILILLSD